MVAMGLKVSFPGGGAAGVLGIKGEGCQIGARILEASGGAGPAGIPAALVT